jgi:hypothetical protein
MIVKYLKKLLVHQKNSVSKQGSVKDVMLLIEIGFADSFGITSPLARNEASARLCEVWNKPKQSLMGSRSSSLHYS